EFRRVLFRSLNLWEAMRRVDRVDGLNARAVKSVQTFVGLIQHWRRMLGEAVAAPGEAMPPALRQAPTPAPAPSQTGAQSDEETLPGMQLSDAETPAPPAAVTDMFATVTSRQHSVKQIMEDVVRRSGLEAMYAKQDKEREEGEGAVDNINELISSAAEFDADHPEGT